MLKLTELLSLHNNLTFDIICYIMKIKTTQSILDLRYLQSTYSSHNFINESNSNLVIE